MSASMGNEAMGSALVAILTAVDSTTRDRSLEAFSVDAPPPQQYVSNDQ